jgi:hypothetical protein
VGAIIFASAYRPHLIVPFMFFGIFIEAYGRLGLALAGVPLTLAKVFVLAAMGIWALHAVSTRQALVRSNPYTLPLIAVMATMTLSLAGSIETGAFNSAIAELMGVVLLTTMLHLLDQLIAPSSLRVQLAMIAVLVAVVLIAGFVFGERVDELQEERYAGAFTGPNMWATSLILTVPVLLGALVTERHLLAVALLLILATLFPLNIFQSLSRAGFLTSVAIAPGLLYLLWSRRYWLIIPLVASVLMLSMVVDPDTLALRYQSLWDPSISELDGSINERGMLFWIGMELLQEHWLAGSGLGMFRFEAMYITNGASHKIAHNTFLTVAVEQGILGVVTHAWLTFACARSAANAIRHAKSPRLRSIGIGYACSIGGFGLMALTLNLMSFAMFYFVLGVGLCLHRANALPLADLVRFGLAEAPAANPADQAAA